MENEETFHTYQIEKSFRRGVSVHLQKSGLNSIQDLLDSGDLDRLIFLWPQEQKEESHLEFWNLYCHFSHFRKADSSHSEESGFKESFESTLVEKISRLKKMENDSKIFGFHTYKIEKFFGRDVSRLLKESGLNTIKDLIDFDNIYNRISLFPQKHRQEFNREFSRVYYCFCFLEEMQKRK